MDTVLGTRITLEELFQKKLEGGIITVLIPNPHWGYISDVIPDQKKFQVHITSAQEIYERSFSIEDCFQIDFGSGEVFLIVVGGQLLCQIKAGT